MQIPGAGKRERELIFLPGTRAEDSRDSLQPSETPVKGSWRPLLAAEGTAQRREQANHSYTNK